MFLKNGIKILIGEGEIEMIKIAWSAGHGLTTAGKRSPNDEKEWTFNNKVVLSGMAHLDKYEGVLQMRVDDPSGKTDIPLASRTDMANAWKADLYISCHHNALGGQWGNHGGIETYVMEPANNNPSSLKLANSIHPKVVKAMELRDRGVKSANFHELRETVMPAVLVEGGFMDSLTDIIKMRDDNYLNAHGVAIAQGIAESFGLKMKEVIDSSGKEETKFFNTGSLSLNNEFKNMLTKAREQGVIESNHWEKKAEEGSLTESEAIGLTAIVLKRLLLDKI